MPRPKMGRINVSLPTDLLARVVEEATRRGESVGSVVREAVRHWTNRSEKWSASQLLKLHGVFPPRRDLLGGMSAKDVQRMADEAGRKP